MTWYEYTVLLGGHIKRSVKEWEHSRFIAYYTYWANSDENRDKITDFLPLITDPEPEAAKELSQEEKDRIFAEVKTREQAFKQIKNGG